MAVIPEIEGLIDTWSEDRRSDTNHGRVTFHGNREIMTHAPASLLEGRVISKEFRFHLIKEVGGKHHLTTYLFGILHIRSHHHQTTDTHMLQLAPLTVTKQFTTRIECQSVFRLFFCNMQRSYGHTWLPACRSPATVSWSQPLQS